MIDEGTCEERKLALVSTYAECNEAVLKLGESRLTVREDGWDWPYCYSFYGSIYFSPKGREEDRLARVDNNYQGLCKKGTIHTTATPVLKPL